MAYLNEKLGDLEKALASWKTAQSMEYSDIARDASIQRFEFSYELFWKTVKTYLKEFEGVECGSPKSCFRKIANLLDIEEEKIELCLEMADSRNFSVHTYSEAMAKDLYDKLPAYLELSEAILDKIKERI
jgi:nucleotidyltransferase substrate binding protein (TIGR01987 family)